MIESKNNTPLIVDLIRGLWNGHTPYPTIDKQIKVNMQKRTRLKIETYSPSYWYYRSLNSVELPDLVEVTIPPYLEFIKGQLEND